MTHSYFLYTLIYEYPVHIELYKFCVKLHISLCINLFIFLPVNWKPKEYFENDWPSKNMQSVVSFSFIFLLLKILIVKLVCDIKNFFRLYQRVFVVPRPWRQTDGTVNRPTLKLMLESVLILVMSRPGITYTDVTAQYNPILQPVPVLELLEVSHCWSVWFCFGGH